MAHEGASGSAAVCGGVSPDARLVVAERQYQQGVQAIRDNKLEEAVQLFGSCLEKRMAVHGDQAAECGSAYYRYGAALFYKAQDEADVFGDNLQGAAEQHDAQVDDHEPAEAEAGPSGGAGPSSGDATEASNGAAAAGEREGVDSDDEGGAGAQAGEQTDMQLAWSMLEVAKLIFGSDRAANALDLADVHLLLGDLSSENDAFPEALTDYQTALELLGGPLPEGKSAPVRRLAELHFKAGLALQFQNRAAPALTHTQTAIALCQQRLTELAAKQPDAAAPAGGGSGSAAAVDSAINGKKPVAATADGGGRDAETAGGDGAASHANSAEVKEAEALGDSLDGLQERLTELQEILAEEEATKRQLKAAFASIAGAAAAGSSGGAGPSSGGAGARPEAQVQNLGVVGRGQRRITLAPQPAAQRPQAEGAAAAAASAEAPSKKRRLDDLMGGGCDTTFGFGTAPAASAAQPAAPAAGAAPGATAVASPPAATPAAAPAQQPAASAAAAAPAVLPAFLQPAAIKTAYGSNNGGGGRGGAADGKSDKAHQ